MNTTFLALCAIIAAVIIIVAWIVLPLVVMSRLKRIENSVELSRRQLESIQINTAAVARFFNERDVITLRRHQPIKGPILAAL